MQLLDKPRNLTVMVGGAPAPTDEDIARDIAKAIGQPVTIERIEADPERCLSCRFWKQTARVGQRVDGICRRQAPLPNMRIADTSFWPAVSPNDWCGDYERS